MNAKPDRTHLGRLQRAVIDDMLNGLNQYQALEKNKVSPCRYKKWLENELFTKELNARIDAATSQGKFITVRSLPKAVERLAQLMLSEKDETARKACLDIINLQKANQEQEKAERDERAKSDDQQPKLSQAKAAKIWAILAEDEPDESENQTPGGMAVGATGGRPLAGHVDAIAQIPVGAEFKSAQNHVVGADPCVCPRPNTNDDWPSPDSTMSYGEWIEKNGLPQLNGWQPPKEPALSDSEWVDGDCLSQLDTNNEQPIADMAVGATGGRPLAPGGMAISEHSERGHVTTNPDREAGLKNHREAALSLERATERRRLMARPARGVDLSIHNKNKTLIKRY